MSTFKERKEKSGDHGELVFSRALDARIIKNIDWKPGPVVTAEWGIEKKQQIHDQAEFGDISFIDEEGFWNHVDVKSGVFIADDSLNRFRIARSYYFLNAFTYSQNCFYFMVRADLEFRQFALSLPPEKRGEATGRLVHWHSLPAHYTSTNGNLVEFDPKLYRNLVIERWEECIEENIPYTKRYCL